MLKLRAMTAKGTGPRAALALPAGLAVLGIGALAVYGAPGRTGNGALSTPSITAKPARLTKQTSAQFRFTDRRPGVRFLCSVDGSRSQVCASPMRYKGPLADGRHTFRVWASSRSGGPRRSSPGSYTWTVDRQPPAPLIVGHPGDPTGSTSATFAFAQAGPSAGLECRLDGAAWRFCANRITYTRMPVGQHQLLVRALDPPAVPSPAAWFPWRITQATGASPVIAADTIPGLSDAAAAPPPIPAGMGFAINAGAIPGLLYPGAAPLSIPVTLSNPNSVPIYVTSLNTTVTGSPPGCDSASNIILAQSNVSGANSVQIPANGSVTLPAQGVSAPTIALLDLPVNQDACINGTLPLGFSGSAHS